jgi:hypothetical protein
MGATGTEPIRIFAGQAPSEILPALHTLALQERPALVIVDTLQRLIRAKDFSDYAEMTERFEPLLRLARETGATLLLLSHASTHQQRAGLDAVLGSTALTGSVDNVLILTRTDKYRALSSVQRIGKDLEPVVIGLDEETGRVELAGRKRDVDEADAAARILEALADQEAGVTESWIKGHIEGGNTATLPRALRLLLRQGGVTRTGHGGKGDVFRYQAVPGFRFSGFTGFSSTYKTYNVVENKGDFEVLPKPLTKPTKSGRKDLGFEVLPTTPNLLPDHATPAKAPVSTEADSGFPKEDDDARVL